MPNDQITLDEITAALDQLATDVLSNENRPSAEELHARLCAIAAAVREVSAAPTAPATAPVTTEPTVEWPTVTVADPLGDDLDAPPND